jgi:hypothetical protein
VFRHIINLNLFFLLLFEEAFSPTSNITDTDNNLLPDRALLNNPTIKDILLGNKEVCCSRMAPMWRVSNWSRSETPTKFKHSFNGHILDKKYNRSKVYLVLFNMNIIKMFHTTFISTLYYTAQNLMTVILTVHQE